MNAETTFIRRVILSAHPLSRHMRERFGAASSDAIVFMDLASLRRGGLRNALRKIHDSKAASITVTGEETDLEVFRDILFLVAATMPGVERFYESPGQFRKPLSWKDFLLALTRVLVGMAAGAAALSANLMRLARISSRKAAPRPAFADLNRCLYLKPALNLGAAVGGAVGHVAGVANALRRRGQRIRMLAAAGQPLLDRDIDQVVIPPSPLAAYPNEFNLFRYHRKFAAEALRQARKFRPDYLYQRYSLNDLTGIYLRRRLGIPLILEFNGFETWIQRHWGNPLHFQAISEKIEAANLRSADLVIVVSEEIRRQVIALGIPDKRILFYPNGVDEKLFDPERFDSVAVGRIRTELGVPIDADLFTFVGTFGQWHGTDILATAIRRMMEDERRCLENSRIHFLLVGEGHYGSVVRSILGPDLGAPWVTLAGYRPQHETPGILAASDVCLSPHIPNPDGTPFFGSPTKLFEYMAMAKPIIASDLDQIGWVLRGWEPGTAPPVLSEAGPAAAVLVEPGSVDSLVAAISGTAQMSHAERNGLGQKARSYVKDFYTWDRNVAAVMRAFEDLRDGIHV